MLERLEENAVPLMVLAAFLVLAGGAYWKQFAGRRHGDEPAPRVVAREEPGLGGRSARAGQLVAGGHVVADLLDVTNQGHVAVGHCHRSQAGQDRLEGECGKRDAGRIRA